MIYRNTKTGAVIDSPCTIAGGDWIADKPAKATKQEPEATEETAKEKPAQKRR